MAQSSSTSHLPPELLTNIFEEIQRTQILKNLRLVSHQFDALVAPILFRRINLTWDIAQEFQRSADSAGWTTQQLPVIHHTRHFVVDQALSWPFIGSTLLAVRRLEHLTLSKWDLVELLGAVAPATQSPLSTIIAIWPKLRIVIEGVSLCPKNHFLITIAPCPQVVSYQFVYCDPLNFDVIKSLLLRAPNLERLNLTCAGLSVDDSDIRRGERLPALKELILHSYLWHHSAHTATNFWNWTKITHLELVDVCLVNFLWTVPWQDLVQLKVLVLENCCRCGSQGVHRALVPRLNSALCLLLERIHSLVKLGIQSSLRSILYPAMRHGASLTSLCLRDLEDHALRNEDLTLIRVKCRKLTYLALDVRFNSQFPQLSKPSQLIDEALAKFRNLRRLTVYTNLEQQDSYQQYMVQQPPIVQHRPQSPHLRRPPSQQRSVQQSPIGLYETHMPTFSQYMVTEPNSLGPLRHDYLSTDITVQTWLRGLLAAKTGAAFERVIVCVGIGNVDLTGLPSAHLHQVVTYTYTEGQSVDSVVGERHLESI
ncbi:hypothetical protein N7G274_010583 [Stereocaulon virgatum]|uniref:F-box domain-containing protein n=1 Tax=Stereocaulon virgatum TaxID=373712 RepID=A0ABR3ZVP6_9LECA